MSDVYAGMSLQERLLEKGRLLNDPNFTKMLEMTAQVLESLMKLEPRPGLRNSVRIRAEGSDGPRVLVWGRAEFVSVHSPSDDAIPLGVW